MRIGKYDYIVDGVSLLGLMLELAGVLYGIRHFLDSPVLSLEDICLEVFFYGPALLLLNLGCTMGIMIVPLFLITLFGFNLAAVSSKRNYRRQNYFLYRRTNAIWLNLAFVVFTIVCGLGLFVGAGVAGSRF